MGRKPTGGRRGSSQRKQAKPRSSQTNQPRKQIRCTLATVANALSGVTSDLQPMHIELMKKTPFYLLLNSIRKAGVGGDSYRKLEHAVTGLVVRCDPKRRTLMLGGEEVLITKETVRIIFGLVDGSQEIDFNPCSKKPSNFAARNFPGKTQFDMAQIRARLTDVVKVKSQDAYEDTVRMFCIILVVSLFCPTTGTGVPWGLLEFVEDLELIRQYDWSGFILDYLMSSIEEKINDPHRVIGCTILLLFCFCEHTSLVQPAKAGAIPRCLKWNVRDLSSVITSGTLNDMSKEHVKSEALRQTKKEMAMYQSAIMDACIPIQELMEENDRGMLHFETQLSEDENIHGTQDLEKTPENKLDEEASPMEGVMGDSDFVADEDDDFQTLFRLRGSQPVSGGQNKGKEKVEYSGSAEEIDSLRLALDKARHVAVLLQERNKLLMEEVEMLKADNVELKRVVDEMKVKEGKTGQETKVSEARIVGGNNGIELEIMSEDDFVALNEAVHSVTQFAPTPEFKIKARRGKAKVPSPPSRAIRVKERTDRIPSRLLAKEFEVDPLVRKEKQPTGPEMKKYGLTSDGLDRLLMMKKGGGKYLSDGCATKLRRLFGEPRDCVWRDDNFPTSRLSCPYVYILAIFRCEYISGMVINAYAVQIMKDPSFDGKSVVMRTTFWESLIQEKDKEQKKTITLFVDAVQRRQVVMFPILTRGRDRNSDPNHWTLLVYDHASQRGKGAWRFYNSMMPKKGLTDYYAVHARELKDLVVAQSGLKIGNSMAEVKEIAQQGESADCAIFVCYYFRKMMKHEMIKSVLSVEDVNRMKAHVVETIVQVD